MKIRFLIVISLLVVSSGFAQQPQDSVSGKNVQPEVVATGIALFWQTLSVEEKNTFLTGYLMSHYDVLQDLKNSYNRSRDIQSEMEQTVAYFRINSYDERQRFIELIDQYYKRKNHRAGSFSDALRYAHRILQYELSGSVQSQ